MTLPKTVGKTRNVCLSKELVPHILFVVKTAANITTGPIGKDYEKKKKVIFGTQYTYTLRHNPIGERFLDG